MLYQHAQLVLGQIYILDFCNIPQLNSRNHEIFFRCTSFSKAIMMIVCAHSLRYYTYYYYVFLAFVRLSHSMCHGALLTIDLPIYSKVLQNNLFVFNCKFYKKILEQLLGIIFLRMTEFSWTTSKWRNSFVTWNLQRRSLKKNVFLIWWFNLRRVKLFFNLYRKSTYIMTSLV